MISVKRPDKAPPILKKDYGKSTKWGDDTSEDERAKSVFDTQGNVKGFEFKRYKEKAVKDALETLFHGKCAYCETFYQQNQPVDVEHYRPKGNIQGQSHGGYWWLAADWENLLPSCIDCNRRRKQSLPEGEDGIDNWRQDWSDSPVENMGKKDVFQLYDDSPHVAYDESLSPEQMRQALRKEKRLLIDPTRDDPADYIDFNVGSGDKYSLVFAKTGTGDDLAGIPHYNKGVASIQTYGLNRLGLVQARTRVLRDLEFMLDMSTNLEGIAVKLSQRADSTDIAEEKLFLNSIHANIRTLLDDIINKFEEMTQPGAPFSALVTCWLQSQTLDTA